jgi:hypothetical protein
MKIPIEEQLLELERLKGSQNFESIEDAQIFFNKLITENKFPLK